MFIFVAHKSDSADYCMNCLMESYYGDFYEQSGLDADELTKLWADYLFKNLNLRCNETGYDFYIYKDGIKIWDQYHFSWYSSDEDVAQENENEITAIFNNANELAKTKKAVEIAKTLTEKIVKKQKEEAIEKEKRREEFEKLKTEFEG